MIPTLFKTSATAHATQRAAVRRLKPIGDFVHTITFDNGKEFAAHQDIAHALKAKIFFATPYHAWERGLNENTNGLIRDFFPKGTHFSTIANADVAKVEREPMRMWPISTRVNKPENDDPSIVEPIELIKTAV
jgi:IS30 family transposase